MNSSRFSCFYDLDGESGKLIREIKKTMLITMDERNYFSHVIHPYGTKARRAADCIITRLLPFNGFPTNKIMNGEMVHAKWEIFERRKERTRNTIANILKPEFARPVIVLKTEPGSLLPNCRTWRDNELVSVTDHQSFPPWFSRIIRQSQ